MFDCAFFFALCCSTIVTAQPREKPNTVSFEDGVMADHKNKETIQSLIDTVNTVTASSKNIQEAVENIIVSCHTHGTKGAAHKDELLAKVDDLRKLTALYKSAARQLMGIARKLAVDKPDNKALGKLLAYGQFLTDQLKSEEEDAKRILDIMRKEKEEKKDNHTR